MAGTRQYTATGRIVRFYPTRTLTKEGCQPLEVGKIAVETEDSGILFLEAMGDRLKWVEMLQQGEPYTFYFRIKGSEKNGNQYTNLLLMGYKKVEEKKEETKDERELGINHKEKQA
nr:MAG TPA: protein of unknown function (DUF3127) [Caudoviricetes sp.]